MAEGANNHYRCRRCGGGVDPGDRFCQGCGVNLTGQVHQSLNGRPCPSCGRACPRWARFCNGCGQRLREERHSSRRPVFVVGGLLLGLIVAAGFLANRDTDDAVADRQDVAREVARATDAPNATPPVMTDEWKAQYPPLGDVREVVVRPWNRIGEKASFRGWIYWIQVARPGDDVVLGDDGSGSYGAELAVMVETPERGFEVVLVGYDGDTTGMFDWTTVRVYGTLVDTETYGDEEEDSGYAMPVFAADLVEIDPFDGLPASEIA